MDRCFAGIVPYDHTRSILGPIYLFLGNPHIFFHCNFPRAFTRSFDMFIYIGINSMVEALDTVSQAGHCHRYHGSDPTCLSWFEHGRFLSRWSWVYNQIEYLLLFSILFPVL